MLEIAGAGRSFTMVPGDLRSRPEHDNAVGQHMPPSSSVVRHFMDYFERTYALTSLSSHNSSSRYRARTIALTTFTLPRWQWSSQSPDESFDGSLCRNRRSRIVVDLARARPWTASGADGRAQYKQMMAYADSLRFGDLDGRGNLSEKALVEFSVWFMQVCLDQILFMSEQFQLGSLTDRLTEYAEKKFKRKQASALLTEVMHRGEVSRGDAVLITGLKSAREESF